MKTIYIESSRNSKNRSTARTFGNRPEPKHDLPFVCTKQELAEVLNVSPRHIDNLTRRRLLRATHLGRSVRYTRTAVLEALNKLESNR